MPQIHFDRYLLLAFTLLVAAGALWAIRAEGRKAAPQNHDPLLTWAFLGLAGFVAIFLIRQLL